MRTLTLIAALLATTTALAQESDVGGQVGEMSLTAEDLPLFKKDDFSPYAGRRFPTKVLWGDTHLHTSNSLDARAFGVLLDPAQAYRFARGEEVTTSHGVRVRLSRPLDWLVVADHSDGMGAMNEIIAGDATLLRDPTIKDWNARLNQGGETGLVATMDVITSFSAGKIPAPMLDRRFAQSIWDEYVETAEAFNEPGRFTTIIGYEWTPTAGGNNLHRNVLYRDGADRAQAMLPFTTAESFNPEDLWHWMETYEDKTGGRVLALAHNGNLSNGIMFPVEKNPTTGEPLSAGYAETRLLKLKATARRIRSSARTTNSPTTRPGTSPTLVPCPKKTGCCSTNTRGRRSRMG